VPRIRFGVYLQEGGPKLGRGKIELLKAVGEQGSISAAARSMGMAYRHAWLLLDELNRSFTDPVIASTMGGPRGGGARLTEWGAELVDWYEEVDRLAAKSVAAHLRALEGHLPARGSRARRSGARVRPRR
jgi:molybdate transport system regulatory protein